MKRTTKVESLSALARTQHSLRFPKFRLAAARHVSGVATSQLPALLQRTDHLSDRDVDAVRSAVLAGLSPDGIIPFAGIRGIRVADSCVSAGPDRRGRGGPLQPPPLGDRNTDFCHAARLHPFCFDAPRTHQGV